MHINKLEQNEVLSILMHTTKLRETLVQWH
jgi:hypothetical protein